MYKQHLIFKPPSSVHCRISVSVRKYVLVCFCLKIWLANLITRYVSLFSKSYSYFKDLTIVNQGEKYKYFIYTIQGWKCTLIIYWTLKSTESFDFIILNLFFRLDEFILTSHTNSQLPAIELLDKVKIIIKFKTDLLKLTTHRLNLSASLSNSWLLNK